MLVIKVIVAIFTEILRNVGLQSISKPSCVYFLLLWLTFGGMKRADVERFKLYTGLSRHVLYRLLAIRCG